MLEKIVVENYSSKSFVEVLKEVNDKLGQLDKKIKDYYKATYVHGNLYECYTAGTSAFFTYRFYPSFDVILEKDWEDL